MIRRGGCKTLATEDLRPVLKYVPVHYKPEENTTVCRFIMQLWQEKASALHCMVFHRYETDKQSCQRQHKLRDGSGTLTI
jgi:hypothetical protein